jgi:Uma2 family endonuclease
MSSTLPTLEHLDFDAFILAYGESDVRYEMYDGDVFAMAGGSPNHGHVAMNAAVCLRLRARPRGCTTYGSDVYIRPDDDDKSAMLPDAFVRCGPPLPKGQRYISDPIVIVEVLSPSTMSFDRGAKLQRYFNFTSLQHVIILYQDEYRAEMWTRPPEGAVETDVDGNLLWTRTVANGLTASLAIEALGDTIELSEFYDGVELAA